MATYYVAKTGNDSTGDGSFALPWLTIGHAENNATSPGDVVYIREGTYNETVTCQYSGSAGNFITFVGYPWDNKPVLRKWVFSGVSYVRIIGLEITHVDNTVNGAIGSSGTTSYIQLLDCNIHNVRGASSGGGYSVQGSADSTYWTLRGNTIYYMGYISGVYSGTNNTAVGTSIPSGSPGERHWLVEYNNVSRSHDFFTVFGAKSIFRNNWIHDTDPDYWDDDVSGFHVDGFQQGSDGGAAYHRNVVYESNYFSDMLNYSDCHAILMNDNTGYGDTDIIVRGNIVENMAGGLIGGVGTDYLVYYNNVWYEVNLASAGGEIVIMHSLGGADVPHYVTCINNILADAGTNPMTLDDGNGPEPYTSEYNLGYDAGSDSSYVSTSNPLFTNAVGNDFSVESGSPARGAGRPVAIVTSATGSGTSFTVSTVEAKFFTDGYDIAEGDLISVGSGSVVRITDITGTTITVDQSISWTLGDGVFWRYDQGALDIGAYPYKSGGYAITVSLTNPTAGNVSGTVAVTASINDPTNVRMVIFYIDGIPVQTDYDSPYTYSWDTSGLANGSTHRVEARSYPLYASTTLYDSDYADVQIGESSAGGRIVMIFGGM